MVDESSTNNCPWSFCGAPGRTRRCFNIAVPSACSDRERVKWGERELYGDGEIKLFEISRNYKELVERLDIERVDNYIEILPCVETDAAAVDDNVDDNITYLTLTEIIKGEVTIPNVDRNFELIVRNNICSYYIDAMEKRNDDDYYNYNNKNVSVIENEWCRRKIRVLFDDGG